jgi:hypothetical protein
MIGAILGLAAWIRNKVKILFSANITGNLDANVTDTSIGGFVLAKSDVTNYDRTTDSLEALHEAHDVPTADSTDNAHLRDVVGNKTDAAVSVVGTDKGLIGYIKGLIQWLAQKTVPKTATLSGASTSYTDIINIFDKGVLTGVNQFLKPSGGDSVFDHGYIKIIIDSTTILDYVFTYGSFDSGVACDMGHNSLHFDHPFSTSLQIQYKVGDIKLTAYNIVAYTID